MDNPFVTTRTDTEVEKEQMNNANFNGETRSEGLTMDRFYTEDGVHPYEKIVWEERDAVITSDKGEVIFSQKNIEMPKFWSQTATNIAASHYFRGRIGTAERETGAKQMVGRVAKTISKWGFEQGYFKTKTDADIYEEELTYILVNQHAAFNSPVWYNVGVEEHPQCSACFINSVQDDMRSILNLAVTEGMLFKYGSGTGTNFSVLRSSKEYLAGSNGKASGPVSFMKGFDAFAGVIKSGGKTRRAAKMVILNIEHPDILEFINCKAEEEKKAWALIEMGFDGSMNGSAYSSIFFQNANNSVRATDDFMASVEKNGSWQTRYVNTGDVADTYKAREIMDQISKAAWICGDPGLQFDTTINDWHTCPNTDRIHASNPCAEYMFLNDSACNLASINLMKYRQSDGTFDTEAFKHTVGVLITAQEIIVANSSYPTPAIEKNSHDYRPLGLGYANLGALLMSKGLPYDSDEARDYAGAITALMTGHAYYQSAKLAKVCGPFKGYAVNRQPMLRVIAKHKAVAESLPDLVDADKDLALTAKDAWIQAEKAGEAWGFRNAQTTVLAPTGTISFLMDCDTTGVEPDIALVKYKWLVGGGMMKMVNSTVPAALIELGYDQVSTQVILDYIDKNDTIEGAPGLSEKHLAVFDCAFKPKKGTRFIHYLGHLRMMGAVQPFLSGAISKTVNMPETATPEEISEVYTKGWKMGLKAIAIYRENSKKAQPLTTGEKDGVKKEKTTGIKSEVLKPVRRKLPDERQAITHKFSIANHEGYLTVGLYEDGTMGELFIQMAKEGSIISGLMDAFATSISIGLQYGVPLKTLVRHFIHARFEPSGFTNNPNIRIAKSLVDYIFRWLALKFLPAEDLMNVGLNDLDGALNHKSPLENLTNFKNNNETNNDKAVANLAISSKQEEEKAFQQTSIDLSSADDSKVTFDAQGDAPVCGVCGSMMVRNGACYKCLNCGGTSGCS